MQVAATAGELDLIRVAALVLPISGMQGLMDVADEMHDEFQCFAPRGIVLRSITEHVDIVGKGCNHAAPVTTIARRYVIAGRVVKIDIVRIARPLPQRSLVRIVLHLIGPTGYSAERISVLGCQKVPHLRLRGRTQLLLREVGNYGMAQRSPGLRRADQHKNTQRDSKSIHGTHNAPPHADSRVCHSADHRVSLVPCERSGAC